MSDSELLVMSLSPIVGVGLGWPIAMMAKYPDSFARCGCKHAAGKKGTTKAGATWEVAACPFVSGIEQGEHWAAFAKRRHAQCKCKHKFDCIAVAHIPPYLSPGEGFEPGSDVSDFWIRRSGNDAKFEKPIPNPAFDAIAWRPKP